MGGGLIPRSPVGRVRLLDDALVDKIAAGEVVERAKGVDQGARAADARRRELGGILRHLIQPVQ